MTQGWQMAWQIFVESQGGAIPEKTISVYQNIG